MLSWRALLSRSGHGPSLCAAPVGAGLEGGRVPRVSLGAAGELGVSLAAAAAAVSVVTVAQLPAFLLSRGHLALGGGQGGGSPRTSTPTVPEVPSNI